MRASFCPACGGPIELRPEDGRERETCTACGFVVYRNPLPVAASVVLNDGREVLLVKRAREPNAGMWCLPMGFAELDEPIRGAALRELREEAGILGEVRTLLHADSYKSSVYGDLLIVSFEVAKTGGDERAGDDAEAFGYFPLADLPPLAFRSNDRAIAACVALHRDAWRIRDSFSAFQEDLGGPLLSDPALIVIEEHSDEITRAWFDEMLTGPTTLCYRRLDPTDLRQGAQVALSRLRAWMHGTAAAEEVRAFYHSLGARRAAQGCPLYEVLSSISLLKLQVWRFTRSSGAWETPVDAYRVLELSFLVNSFFDRASYYVARGYAESESTPAQ